MKKKVIFLVLTVLVISVLLLAGCGEPKPEVVTRAEYDGFKVEVTGRLDTTEQNIGGIQEAVKDLPTIRENVLAIKGLLEGSEGQSDELVDLKIRMAVNEVKVDEREKDIAELRQDVKDIPRPQPPVRPAPQPSFREKVSFLVTEAGRYKFTLIPTDATILIDGKTEIGNGDAVYLKAGKHWYFSYDSIKVTIIRKY